MTNKLDNLKELRERQSQLMVKLERSLMIQDLWPEAFDHGSVSSKVVGNIYRTLTLTITRGDGTERAFDLAEVPVDLWPSNVVQELKNHHKANRTYKRCLRGL